jgi:hypothetical protein
MFFACRVSPAERRGAPWAGLRREGEGGGGGAGVGVVFLNGCGLVEQRLAWRWPRPPLAHPACHAPPVSTSPPLHMQAVTWSLRVGGGAGAAGRVPPPGLLSLLRIKPPCTGTYTPSVVPHSTLLPWRPPRSCTRHNLSLCAYGGWCALCGAGRLFLCRGVLGQRVFPTVNRCSGNAALPLPSALRPRPPALFPAPPTPPLNRMHLRALPLCGRAQASCRHWCC